MAEYVSPVTAGPIADPRGLTHEQGAHEAEKANLTRTHTHKHLLDPLRHRDDASGASHAHSDGVVTGSNILTCTERFRARGP